MEFLISKEPSLSWRAFYPRTWKREPLPSYDSKPVYRLFWARSAIYHGLRALALLPGDNVLVPAYHCAAAVEPILQYGAKVKFYNIHRDCSPDIDDIRAKVDERTRALLAIHYFGFPQPIQSLQELCRTHRLYLIEDCAHVLYGEVDGAELGTFGDVSVFSWRKFLPIYDGGQLILNNPQLSLDIAWEPSTFLYQLKIVKNTCEKFLGVGPQQLMKFISEWGRARAFPYTPEGNGRGASLLQLDSFSLDFDPAFVNVPMSRLSQYLLWNADIAAIIKQRRMNYRRLLAEMKELPEVTPLFPQLPEKVCPWVFPVFTNGRQNFHAVLREKGIPAVTWGGVTHRTLPLAEFPDAVYLYQQLIFLPLHQSLNESDMRVMGQIVKDALRSGV